MVLIMRQTSDLIQTLMRQRQAVLRLVISVRWPGLRACKYLWLNVIQKTQHRDNDVRNSVISPRAIVIWCVVNSFRPKYCLLFTYNEKHPLFSWHQLTTHYLMLTKEARFASQVGPNYTTAVWSELGHCWLVVYKFTLRGVRISHHLPPTHTTPIMGKYKHCLRIIKNHDKQSEKTKNISFQCSSDFTWSLEFEITSTDETNDTLLETWCQFYWAKASNQGATGSLKSDNTPSYPLSGLWNSFHFVCLKKEGVLWPVVQDIRSFSCRLF